MVSRRTKAIGELLLSVVLFVTVTRRTVRTESSRQSLITPESVIGAVTAISSQWLFDRDYVQLRSNWRRRLCFSFCLQAVTRLIGWQSDDDRQSMERFAIGGLFGGIVYRIRFGLWGPVPE